jgi:Ser/Thr protein kinase RdoA (MazF antagonist)
VLPLSEIVGLASTLDPEGRSVVADAVARRWGVPAGEARFWRSSASHVFRVPPSGGRESTAYLRFRPANRIAPGRLAAVAGLMRDLGRVTAVAAPLASSGGEPGPAGRLVETVATPRGAVHAMLVGAAPGRGLEVEDLTAGRARAWGAALARLHRAGAAVEARLPDAFAELDRAERVLSDDAPLLRAVVVLRGRLRSLPRRPDGYGITHGDYELDNLAWTGDTPTAYDFDDAARSWFAADIAQATRDLGVDPDDPRLAAFLAGYRGERDLPGEDSGRLSTFAAAHSAAWLIRLPEVLDYGQSSEDPAWLVTLRAKLVAHAARQRTRVLAGADGMPFN